MDGPTVASFVPGLEICTVYIRTMKYRPVNRDCIRYQVRDVNPEIITRYRPEYMRVIFAMVLPGRIIDRAVISYHNDPDITAMALWSLLLMSPLNIVP